MTSLIWSATLTVLFLVGLLLVGRGSPWGWIIGLVDELLWIVYAITTRQWPFIASAIIYATVCARKLREWWRGMPAGARRRTK
jgi:hypothetical protein